jgi:hypothetical protein
MRFPGLESTGGVPAPSVNVAVVESPNEFVAVTEKDWLAMMTPLAT